MRDRVPIAGIVILGGCWLALLGTSARDTSTSGPPRGDAAHGRKTYLSKCVACHKSDGSGGIKLTGNPTPDWRDPRRMADSTYDDDYLRDCITNGKPKSGMVAWAQQGMKAETIEDLITYIRTLSAPPARKKGKGKER